MIHRRLVLPATLVATALLAAPVFLVVVASGSSASNSQCSSSDGVTLAVSTSVGAAASDPQWGIFLEAEREQESGNYQQDSSGCEGAYCWLDAGIWSSMAAEAGVDVGAYQTANLAPPVVQDAVFTGVSWPVYQRAGGGQPGYLAAAASWNGGTTAVVVNPVLGTNYVYAEQVLAKMAALLGQGTTTSFVSSSEGEKSVTCAVDIGTGEASIVTAVESQLGVPYVWGGTTPGVGFDCSGLVQWAYRQVGISLPRTSEAQWSAGPQLPAGTALEPGDLVFFVGSGDGGTVTAPGHVGIYIGGGQMIDAPYTGVDVRVDAVSSVGDYVGATRPWD